MTVRINKDAINLREKLSQLDKPSGLVGEELLRADTSADAREALNLEEHLFEDFESTGIDDNATSTVVTVSDSGLDVAGNLSLGDNDKATFGASDALQIYHSGTNSFISEIGTGDLRIRSNKIRMEAPDSQNMIIVTEDAGVQAFYNGTERLSVTPTGVYVTDTITAVNTSAGSTKPLKLYNNTLGANNQVGIDFHTAGTLYGTIEAGYGASSPEMNLKVGNAPSKAMTLKGGGDVHFYEDTGTTAKFVWDASAETLNVDGRIKTGTTSDGVSIGSNTGKGEVLGVDTAGNGWNALDIRAGALTQLYLNTDGNVGIGTASPSAALDVVGDIKVSGGVYLGGTGTANKLDDYEEGEWTPAITGSTTVGSYSSVIAIGYYTKIGNLVTITGVFNGASGTGAGDLQLTNLPFSVVSDSVGVIQANLGLIYPTGTVDACLMGSGSTTLKVRCNKSDGSAYTHMAYPATASYVRFTLSYKTA